MDIKERLLNEKSVTVASRIEKTTINGFGEVYIKKLTISERAELETEMKKIKELKGITENTIATKGSLIILKICLCNEHRQPLLTQEDIDSFTDLGADWTPVVEKCMDINHLMPEQIETAKKK